MRLRSSVQIAVRALGANKLRAVLTMLGVIIGVGAVVTMISIGQGARASVSQQVQSLGSNLLTVFPGSAGQGGVRQGLGSLRTLTLDDAEAIAPEIQQVEAFESQDYNAAHLKMTLSPDDAWGGLTDVAAVHPDHDADETVRSVRDRFAGPVELVAPGFEAEV